MSAPTGDFGQDYLERRQQSVDDALDQEYASILSGSPQAQPQPADPQLQDPSTPAPSEGPSLLGRAGRDVVRGTVALPSEALGGAVDAVHQEASTVKDLADWVSTKLPNALRGGIAYTPEKGLHFASGDEIQALPGALESIAGLVPTTEGSGTVTGGVGRSIAQFLTGKAILGPILGNLGQAGMMGAAAEQAAVGATAFDPQQHVSDLIQQVPALQNPVNEWLSSQPGDTAAEGRLKNAIEGMGLGLASEGLFRALKAVKAKIFAKYAERAAGDEQGLARQVVAQVDEQNRAMAEIIGDPTQPAVTVQPKQAATSAEGELFSTLETAGDMAETLAANPLPQRRIELAKMYEDQAAIARSPEQAQLLRSQANQLREAAGAPPAATGTGSRAIGAGDPTTAARITPSIPAFDPGMPSEEVARAITEAHGPGEVHVNWSAMTDDADLNSVIQTLADALAPERAAAKGGVIPWEATRRSAADLDAMKVLTDGVPRGALDQNQIKAVQEVFFQSAEEVRRLGRMVTSGAGGDYARIAFDRQLSLHAMIDSRLTGYAATAGRTLNILKDRSGGALSQAKRLAELRQLTSGSNLDEIARGVTAFAEAGKTREMDAFIRASQGATNPERVRQLWYGMLLSNPKTHMRNIVGNTANLLLDFPETALAEGNDVAVEKLYGLVSSYRDVWTLARRGADVLEGQITSGLDDVLSNSKMDRQVGGAFRPEAAGLDPDSMVGRFFSLMDTATTFQGKALDRADRVFKAMNWHMERRALAFREAKDELARGVLDREDLPSRLAELMANPSDASKQAAHAFAEVKTFQNQPLNTSWYQAVDRMSRVKFWGPFLLPFKKTPYNVATQILQRTPAAPFMTSWAQDIAAGGTRAEYAWSRFVLGNAVLLTAADLTLSGYLTGEGPSDPAQRATLARQGWQPWSAKIGDRYVDVRALDPIGSLLGLAAFTAETIAGQDFGDESGFDRTQQVATAAGLAIGAQMLDRSFMSGMSSFMDAVLDPKRAGDRWIQQAVASAVIPRGVAQLERILDPTQRAAHDLVSTLRAQTPGLSKDLPARRDLWGRPIKTESGNGWVYDMLSPFPMSQEKAEPVDREITRLGARIPMPSQKVSFRVLVPGKGFENATVDLWNRQDIYQRYLQLAGQEVPERLSGKPLLKALNDLVEGKHPLSPLYQRLTDGPDGGKSDQIRKLMRETQEEARQRLLREYPELLDAAITKASKNPGKFDLN